MSAIVSQPMFIIRNPRHGPAYIRFHTPPSLPSAVQARLLLYVDAAVAAGVVSVRIGSPYVVYVRVAFGAAAGPARPPLVLVGVRADMGLATLPASAVQGT